MAVSAFGQDRHSSKITQIIENGVTSTTVFVPQTVVDNFAPDYAIAGADGYWDYMTNGSNMQNIAVFGDTIIIAYPNTDSSDALGATSRVAYYIVSVNGGVSWDLPLGVSTLPARSGYPEVQSFILSGSRQVVLNGRRYNGANSRGGAWKDAFFGLGSFVGANAPQEGRDFFGQYQSNGNVGGLFNVPNGTAAPIFDTLFFTQYNFNTNTFSPRVKVAEPSLNQIGGNTRYNFAASGNDALAMWYKDSNGTSFTGMMYATSSNGGTTWNTPVMIQKSRGVNSVLAPGDTCSPWFGIDAAYKPGTSTFGMVWSTLGPTADNTGNNTASNGSCKILFHSPGINGGVPVIVAGKQNMTIISDTSKFNNRQSLQVGSLPVSHPSIGYSADGSRIFVAFHAFQPGDSADSFTFNDIYYTYSDNGGTSWATPINLTNTPNQDEMYPTISLSGNLLTKFHVHYQSTAGPGSSSFTDNKPVYRVYQCYRAVTVPVSVNNISTVVPERFSLKQNFPNPFNPTTSIRFDVAKASKMTLKIFDMSGKLVETLLNNEDVTVGTNEVSFNAGKLSSGVYFYTLSSDNFSETKKMMLVK